MDNLDGQRILGSTTIGQDKAEYERTSTHQQ